MTSTATLEKECAVYLIDRLGRDTLIRGLIDKYRSYGMLKGSYILKNPTDKERLFLRGFFHKDYSEVKQISVSLKKFEEGFQDTRFEGVCLEGILESFLGAPLLSNKEIEALRLNEVAFFFDKLSKISSHEDIKKWLLEIKNTPTSAAYQWLLSKRDDNSISVNTLIKQLNCLISLAETSNRSMIRQVAAVKVTKDAHALDDKMPLWRMLMYYLTYKTGLPFPLQSEDVRKLLFLSNIIDGDLHNTIITYGLEAMSQISFGWRNFYDRQEPLIVSTTNLLMVEKIITCGGEKKVYCFENPAVFYIFVQLFPEKACVCSSGQINQCGYRLFELLMKSDLLVYYHGDHDPEGLIIADKIKTRFSNVRLYGYDPELYLSALSEEIISIRRLKQLEKIQSEELITLSEKMKKVGKAAYEEAMMARLFSSDIVVS